VQTEIYFRLEQSVEGNQGEGCCSSRWQRLTNNLLSKRSEVVQSVRIQSKLKRGGKEESRSFRWCGRIYSTYLPLPMTKLDYQVLSEQTSITPEKLYAGVSGLHVSVPQRCLSLPATRAEPPRQAVHLLFTVRWVFLVFDSSTAVAEDLEANLEICDGARAVC
jgi:hypothetical protein